MKDLPKQLTWMAFWGISGTKNRLTKDVTYDPQVRFTSFNISHLVPSNQETSSPHLSRLPSPLEENFQAMAFFLWQAAQGGEATLKVTYSLWGSPVHLDLNTWQNSNTKLMSCPQVNDNKRRISKTIQLHFLLFHLLLF